MFIGRPHIRVEIERYFPGGFRFLQIKSAKEDIMRYVQMMLEDDPTPEAMNFDLLAEIMSWVLETIPHVHVTEIFCSRSEHSLTLAPRFLLVSLNIAAILDETTIYDRREQLRKMTNGCGLGDAYGVTLDRIKAQSEGKSRFGMAALMWLSRSEQPMSPDELCHALGVQIGTTDPNPDKIPSIQTLLASCLGLVAVDREESTVRLMHFTLQEYLNSRSEIFQNPCDVMAEVCLTYLNFDCLKKLPPTLDAVLEEDPFFRYSSIYRFPRKLPPIFGYAAQKYPFLQHASNYWGYYARGETTAGVKSLALQLLDKFDGHPSAILFLYHHQLRSRLVGFGKGFTGLHCIAYLGIDEIAEALLDRKHWDVDKPDSLGHTPLTWASVNGCEGIIRLLFEKAGADINAKDTMNGRAPLSWAAKCGQEEVVKLLLDQDGVDLESRDNSSRTALSYAAEQKSEGTLRLLLERNLVNPESQDSYGRTPLSYAARCGSEGTAELLLQQEGVNPESRDKSGRTPLSHAAESGCEGVVRLLLERGEVNPESRDDSGRTPLSRAAGDGEKEALKLLLQRDEVNPESRDRRGRTPLAWAGLLQYMGRRTQRSCCWNGKRLIPNRETMVGGHPSPMQPKSGVRR